MNGQPRLLIVNADDFGMSSEVNQAIVRCFQRGLISSSTIMSTMPAFEEACQLAHENRLTASIGVHLNFTTGKPLVSELMANPSLCNADGTFRRFRSMLLDRNSRKLLAAETAAQIERCHKAGLPLSHADSHQHVHTEPCVLLAIQSTLRKLGIRWLRISRNMHLQRSFSPRRPAKAGLNRLISFCGFLRSDYLGTVPEFLDFRRNHQRCPFTLEILTHPRLDPSGDISDHVELTCLDRTLPEAFDGLRLSAYP